MHRNFLVTGGCGFIGSAFIRKMLDRADFFGKIINFDALTYAANPRSLQAVERDWRYRFVQGDINDFSLVESVCQKEHIDAIVHFAAETHVDRSIESALPFIEANVKGTMLLLEVIRRHRHIRFHHVSTDEVYGALGKEGEFSEQSPYRPNSPYSASKAAADHLVRAYIQTYGIYATISHCSNNYGPFQHPEKFIPRLLTCCIEGKPIPIYGRGDNVRDWLYVDDHVEAIWQILDKGKPGETYDIGGGEELSNLNLAHTLIDALAQHTGCHREQYLQLIHFVDDRPGHDFRYAIDFSKISRDLGWTPSIDLQSGLQKTVSLFSCLH